MPQVAFEVVFAESARESVFAAIEARLDGWDDDEDFERLAAARRDDEAEAAGGADALSNGSDGAGESVADLDISGLPVVKATAEEAAAHKALLEKIRKSGACVWDFD